MAHKFAALRVTVKATGISFNIIHPDLVFCTGDSSFDYKYKSFDVDEETKTWSITRVGEEDRPEIPIGSMREVKIEPGLDEIVLVYDKSQHADRLALIRVMRKCNELFHRHFHPPEPPRKAPAMALPAA